MTRLSSNRSRFGASLYAVHVDLGALSAVVGNRFEQFSKIGDKQTCPRIGRRRNAPNPVVVIGVILPPNIYEALTQNIDTALAGVEEQVVGMFHHGRRSHDLAGLGVENDQARWHAAANEQP